MGSADQGERHSIGIVAGPMAITIKNLDAPLGAEVSGLDLSKPMPRP